MTEENIKAAELEVLKLSGLPLEQIEQKEVFIYSFDNMPVYVHTVICGDKNKPTLVLIHGWGGSGALFFKIIKSLCRYFCLIFIDLLGMGSSSRPKDFDYNNMGEQECSDYFSDSIEKWRV